MKKSRIVLSVIVTVVVVGLLLGMAFLLPVGAESKMLDDPYPLEGVRAFRAEGSVNLFLAPKSVMGYEVEGRPIRIIIQQADGTSLEFDGNVVGVSAREYGGAEMLRMSVE
jgi:hypothetical protein